MLPPPRVRRGARAGEPAARGGVAARPTIPTVLQRWIGWLAIALACAAVAPALAAPAARHRIVGYVLASPAPLRPVSLESLPVGRLTHLNVAFAAVDADGRIVAEAERFAGLRALKRRHPHLKVLVSVGGWSGSGRFSDVALAAPSRARFADSAVAFIRRQGLDGVDIDWEFPVAGGKPDNARRPEDRRNFTLLLQALREKLDAAARADRRRYLLTAVVGHTEGDLLHTEPAALAAAADWLNVMAYDMNGPWSKVAAHIAPLQTDPAMQVRGTSPRNNVTDLVERWLKAGVPPHQLVLGVPFYGYSWKGCPPARRGEYQQCAGPGRGSWEAGALDYGDVERLLGARSGFERHWNAQAKSAFLYNPATGEFVSYEDPQSLRAKLRLVKQRRLGGVMFWELGADRRQTLLGLVARELRGR